MYDYTSTAWVEGSVISQPLGTVGRRPDVPDPWDSTGQFFRGRTNRDDIAELESEARQPRIETTVLLRDLADQLDAGGGVTVDLGDRRISLDPTEPITAKLRDESDWQPGDTEVKQSIEIELVWRRPAETPAEGALDVSPVGP